MQVVRQKGRHAGRRGRRRSVVGGEGGLLPPGGARGAAPTTGRMELPANHGLDAVRIAAMDAVDKLRSPIVEGQMTHNYPMHLSKARGSGSTDAGEGGFEFTRARILDVNADVIDPREPKEQKRSLPRDKASRRLNELVFMRVYEKESDNVWDEHQIDRTEAAEIFDLVKDPLLVKGMDKHLPTFAPRGAPTTAALHAAALHDIGRAVRWVEGNDRVPNLIGLAERDALAVLGACNCITPSQVEGLRGLDEEAITQKIFDWVLPFHERVKQSNPLGMQGVIRRMVARTHESGKLLYSQRLGLWAAAGNKTPFQFHKHPDYAMRYLDLGLALDEAERDEVEASPYPPPVRSAPLRVIGTGPQVRAPAAGASSAASALSPPTRFAAPQVAAATEQRGILLSRSRSRSRSRSPVGEEAEEDEEGKEGGDEEGGDDSDALAARAQLPSDVEGAFAAAEAATTAVAAALTAFEEASGQHAGLLDAVARRGGPPQAQIDAAAAEAGRLEQILSRRRRELAAARANLEECIGD